LELILQEQKNFGKPKHQTTLTTFLFTKRKQIDEWLLKKIIKDLKEIDYQQKKSATCP
jgi:hypothetical protein